MQEKLLEIYHRLYDHFGPQQWWPGETPYEVMIGAVLTQNTSWNNVEKAIDNLKRAGVLSYEKMSSLPAGLLAEYIRPAGYYNIKAARLQGAGPWRLVWGHIMPLCTTSLIVRVTLDMAGIILTAAGLGFLGLGAQPPLPEWGAMISSGRKFLLDQWWVATMPGVVLSMLLVSINMVGSGLERVRKTIIET